jgi:nucleoside phosphorylase
MGIFNTLFTTSEKVVTKPTYNFLVVAALQEELNDFYKLSKSFTKKIPRVGGAFEIGYISNGNEIKILTYTPNKMGMPFNAAALMKIISLHDPIYTIMIGTCACIAKEHKLGDVLIPDRVFSYESGKYEKGVFKPDYASFPTGEGLRKQAELLKSMISDKINFNVTTDEDFCSGGAVVNDLEISKDIISLCGRKLSGLDMEAYSIACINHVLQGDKELLVIKGISDYAKDKSEAESTGNKNLAKANSAKFAYELIKHLQNSIFSQTKVTIKSS